MRFLALADDGTGALEVGGELAKRASPVRVWFGDGPPSSAFLQDQAAVVINTRSRHLAPDEAEVHVRRMAIGGAARIFKKTDSTLRGNIAAEFRALIHAYPRRPIVYAPAFPDQGRTVSGGELYVHGKRLVETDFARDPLNPAASGCIPELVAECGVPVVVVPEPGQLAAALDQYIDGGILVCDGHENCDLAEAARALRDSTVDGIAAGASVFAGYWAAGEGNPNERMLPPARRCLVVNGSLHPQSRRQVEWARAAGWPVVAWAGASTAIGGSNWTVLTTGDARRGEPLDVARNVGQAVGRSMESGGWDSLLVFGGDTLDEILRSLGCESVESMGLIMPGIPASRIELRGSESTLITKAGGFGDEDVLGRIRKQLEKSE